MKIEVKLFKTIKLSITCDYLEYYYDCLREHNTFILYTLFVIISHILILSLTLTLRHCDPFAGSQAIKSNT